MKEVSVLVGAGSIGLAIARRVGVGKITVLADYSLDNAQRAAKTMEDAGFETRTIRTDLGSKEDILELVKFATGLGPVKYLINAAGSSPAPTSSSTVVLRLLIGMETYSILRQHINSRIWKPSNYTTA